MSCALYCDYCETMYIISQSFIVSYFQLAQRLLNAGTIKSVVNGATEFEDSSQLYHWSDETVVRDAKRLVTTTSSQIPRKKLIELIDLKQGPNTNGTTNGFYLKGG